MIAGVLNDRFGLAAGFWIAGIIGMALLGVVLYEALDAVEAYATRWRKAEK